MKHSWRILLVLMGAVMLLVSVGCGDDIQPGAIGQGGQIGYQSRVPPLVVALQFDKEPVGAKEPGIYFGHLQRAVELLGGEQLRHFPSTATREGDEAFCVIGQVTLV